MLCPKCGDELTPIGKGAYLLCGRCQDVFPKDPGDKNFGQVVEPWDEKKVTSER